MPTAIANIHPDSGAVERSAEQSAGFQTVVLTCFAQAATAWDTLETCGHFTPYQQRTWLEAYFRHVEAPQGRRLALVVMQDRAGLPVLLLPLSVGRVGPCRIAAFIGGKHANFHMPLFRTAGAPGPAALRAALDAAASQAGIDLFAFAAQPIDWEGIANPLAALGGQPSPSQGYKLALEADGEALLARRLSKDTRKKLRQKETKLAQTGEIAYLRPQTGEEAREILDAFLRLKAARFDTQGIDDPFASAGVQAFLAETTRSIRAGTVPTLELHALAVGGRIVSIYGASRAASRFCGIFTAFDSDPQIARSSPGDLLLVRMIAATCREGLKTFDLGVGEARYKAQVCDQREQLIDAFIPASATGHAAALGFSLAMTAKRKAKASPLVTSLLARLRKMRAGAG